MGTEVNAWGGKIRWLEGETVSERVDILDATLFSVFFPTVGAPAAPFTVQASINREGGFQANIENEANVAVSISPTLDTWLSLDESLAEVVAHSHIYFVAGAPAASDYEARYRAKRV